MVKRAEAATHPRQLLSKVDAAAYLTVSVRTLGVLVSSARLPVIRVSARRIAFDIADLERYIAQQRQ